jgi:hypothetical protein
MDPQSGHVGQLHPKGVHQGLCTDCSRIPLCNGGIGKLVERLKRLRVDHRTGSRTEEEAGEQHHRQGA